MKNADTRAQAMIDAVENEELKAALKVVWAHRGSHEDDHNRADWAIKDAGGGDECLTIGIVQW